MRIIISKLADNHYHVFARVADGIERHVTDTTNEAEARTVAISFQRGFDFARVTSDPHVYFDGKIRDAAGEVI